MAKKANTYKSGEKLASSEQSFFKSPYYQPSYQFPYNPDSLCPGNNYRIYDEMRTDDQVKAALSMKKDIAIGTGWQIVCEDEEAKKFLTENLQNINGTGLQASFEECLRNFLSAYDYGFSLGEAVFGIGEDNLYRLKALKVRPPHSFRFDIDDFGNVKKVIQATTRNGDKELDPEIFLHFAYQMEWGNPYGVSDLKAAYIPWKIKKFGVPFYAKYLERFVTPTVHGKYDDQAAGTEAQALYDILKTIQNNSTLVTPKSVEVEFAETSKDGADVYERAVNHLDMKIARAILMPDLLGLSGAQTSGGSYANGTNHFKIFLDTIKKERELLSKKISQKIIRPLAQANWGIEASFEFMPYSAGDELALAELWIKAVQTGKFTPSDEEINRLRQITKMPTGDVERPAPPPALPAPGQNPAVPPKPAGSGSPDQEEGVEDVEAEEVKENKEAGYFRALTPYEKKMNFAEIEDTLNISESRGGTKIRSVAMKIADSIMSQIKDKKILENWKPAAVLALKPKFQKEMNIVFRDHFQDLFTTSYNQAKAEVIPDRKFVDAELLPAEFLDVIEMESFKSVGDYSNDILKRAQNILATGLKNGSPTSEIHKAIREDITGFTDKWVNTVVRTKTNEVYNAARKSFWDNDPTAKQLISGFQFSAILDDRTSDVCSYLDGKMWEKGEFTDRITPPLHFNCRSQLVAVTKFEAADFETPPSIDHLKDMGANLIYQETMLAPAAASHQPTITVSGEISKAGDSSIIAPGGQMTFIKVLAVRASNADCDYPVVVGFRSDPYEALKHKTMLNKLGGLLDRPFEEGWLLPENKGLMLNLSANAAVKWTVEYIIVDINGMRIR